MGRRLIPVYPPYNFVVRGYKKGMLYLEFSKEPVAFGGKNIGG
jgi:hypothetical protein